jgi:tetratricopeptide (TPR) repeat protein
LRNVEAANAAPDRSHNEDLDILLTTGVIGALAYLGWLAASIAVLVRLVMRARSPAAMLVASALLAAFIGHLVEGLTGIAFSCTLMMLWVIVGVATALDAGPGEVALAYGQSSTESPAAGVSDSAIIAEPATAAYEGAGSATYPSESSSPRATGQQQRIGSPPGERNRRGPQGQGRRTDQRPLAPGPQGRAARARSQAASARERGGRTAGQPLLGQLSGLGLSIMGLGTILTIGITALFVALFLANIQTILADVNYRQGQNYEAAAGQLVSQSSTYQEGLQVYQDGIQFYQDALNTVPSWDWPPPQDSYRLFLGKTYLEYAQALENTNSDRSKSALVIQQIQAALQVFLQAAQDNPLNPDHPRNIAKLYNFWALLPITTDPIGELKLSDHYFAKASSLAPHNPDILAEWGYLDIQLSSADSTNARTWFAAAKQHLEAARALDPQDGVVYRDLGTVYSEYAVWAEQAGKRQEALADYRQAVSVWLTALKYDAADYQKIYPRLAEIYATKLNDPCDAGTYAAFGLDALKAGTLTDTGGLQAQLQGVVSAAKSHGCRLSAS